MSFLRRFAFAVLLCPQVAEADDYYVDLDAGNDASSGSQAAPWRTLTHALATVAPSAGHRVLVRGTANLSSPGEVFPIRLPAGISLEAWDAQQGAVLDAEYLPCLEIVGPAHRGQSLRGYEHNLRFLGTPAISVEVLGVVESVDLVVEGCSVGGELRMILAEVMGQTRRGSCALTVRSCYLSDVTVDRRSSSISTTEDVLSVSLEDNIGSSLLLRGLSAPTRPLQLRGNYFGQVDLEDCSAASVAIVGNDFGWMRSELNASSILFERNLAFLSGFAITARGRMEVLSNTVESGSLDIRGAGTTRIERNVIQNGWIDFDSIDALEAPCSILRNGTTRLSVEALGSQPLTIAENYISGRMTLNALPHAVVEVARNVVSQWADPGTGIDLRPKSIPWIPGAPLVTIADNRLQGSRLGFGILVEAALGKLVVERNDIQDFDIGLQISGATVVHGTPNGWSCRIERNAIRWNASGVKLDLSSSQEDLRFLNNEIVGDSEALSLNRATYRGTIRFWNNIVRSGSSRSISGNFAPIDLVWNNLCSDGSLLALHPTNITGDPQFAASGSGLRASSPAVGSGIDPLTAEPGFNMGLDPLQPPASLLLHAQSETNAVLQLEAPNALVALLIFGTAVSDPANLELCDGRAGVDLASGYFLAALPVANGEASLPVVLPPGSWTAVVQALSFTEAPSLTPPCQASNTVVLRR